MPFNNLSYKNKHRRIHTMFKCNLYYHFIVTYCQSIKNKQICTQVACKRLDYVTQFPCVATCGTFPCINECSMLWQWDWNNYDVKLWRQQQCNTGDAWGQQLQGFEALTIGYYYMFMVYWRTRSVAQMIWRQMIGRLTLSSTVVTTRTARFNTNKTGNVYSTQQCGAFT